MLYINSLTKQAFYTSNQPGARFDENFTILFVTKNPWVHISICFLTRTVQALPADTP